MEELLVAARDGAALPLRAPPPPPDALRLVLGLRLDTRALRRGPRVAIALAVCRRRANGDKVEVGRAEWARFTTAQVRVSLSLSLSVSLSLALSSALLPSPGLVILFRCHDFPLTS